MDHQIVSREAWLDARRALLAEEKALTRQRDALARARRALPRVRVDKPYIFDGEAGSVSIADLFGGCGQLVIYHFMFGPDWEEGCKSCSFWADGFERIVVHLNQRDVSFAMVARAPLAKLLAFRRRMGWTLPWVSSLGNDFNRDFNVSFTPDEIERETAFYNFTTGRFPVEEAPGMSVFLKDADGAVFHTYSCYARGLDMLNPAYHVLDLVPKGRDEDELPYTMAWVRHHDRYGG
ncbi:MAG: thioredoxin family protein [Alphaproteobacteria bacterium]